MINFTRAFDNAWERMMIILFRPFDLGKWFVIGFSAFLAGLLRGGNGANFSQSNFNPNKNFHWSYNTTGTSNFGTNPQTEYARQFITYFSGLQIGFAVLLVSLALVFLLALTALFYWLGARGEFMLLDNLTRNRGAIAEPWVRYSVPANRAFGFFLLFKLVGIVLGLLFIVPGLVLAWPMLFHHQQMVSYFIPSIALLGALYLIILLPFAIAVSLFREWGIPLMFRNGISARSALVEVLNLIRNYPGQVILFIFLRVALFIAFFIVSALVCCFTCCIAGLPYLGTVVILPAILYLRCFSLDCLAQFGPMYDVWTVDVAPSPAGMGTTPPPPLG